MSGQPRIANRKSKIENRESPWNPAQYARFADERSQPFFDLLALVRPVPGGRVIDLGCGTGVLTKVLHEQTHARSTVGLDNSETMLEKSGEYAGRGLTFRLGTILRFAPRTPFSVVFSNAALQWCPDHPRLLERLWAGVAPGGQLAFQVPANHDHPSHLVAAEVAGEEPFRTQLAGYVRQVPVLAPEAYARILDDLGAVAQHVRLQVYVHHLAARDEVVEWVRGTLLTDYQQRLSADSWPRFLARYRELLLPQTTLLTPNSHEVRRLAEFDDDDERTLEQCAAKLIETGCEFVLVTGTHESTPQVVNTLYGKSGVIRTDAWPRLSGSYHGSGCTLASALAAGIARGVSIDQAAYEAQDFTYQSLQAAFCPGMGQWIPDRLFWAHAGTEDDPPVAPESEDAT